MWNCPLKRHVQVDHLGALSCLYHWLEVFRANAPSVLLSGVAVQRLPVRPRAPATSLPKWTLVFSGRCEARPEATGSRPGQSCHTNVGLYQLFCWLSGCRVFLGSYQFAGRVRAVLLSLCCIFVVYTVLFVFYVFTWRQRWSIVQKQRYGLAGVHEMMCTDFKPRLCPGVDCHWRSPGRVV